MISLRVLLATMPIGLFFVLRPHSVLAFWTDLDVISFNNMNDSGPVVYDLRVKRISRKEFGISGNVIIGDYQPMQCGARAYFSAKADNQYTLLPLKVAPKACCEQVNDFYVKYVMKDLANFSDLPQVETTGPEVCDMLKNVGGFRAYYFRPEMVSAFFD